jgi:hypothetical protein
LIANANTPCRKFSWLQTVFDDRPDVRLARRKASTRAASIRSSGRSPKNGQVPAQVAAVVRHRRALSLHDELEVLDVRLAGLGHGPPLRAGDHDVGLDPAAQLALGLHARQPVRRPRRALAPDPALDAHTAGPPGPVPALAPAAVATREEPPGAVGTSCHRSTMSRPTAARPRANWNHIGTTEP